MRNIIRIEHKTSAILRLYLRSFFHHKTVLGLKLILRLISFATRVNWYPPRVIICWKFIPTHVEAPLQVNRFYLSSEKEKKLINILKSMKVYIILECFALTLEKVTKFSSANGPTFKAPPFCSRFKKWTQVSWFFSDIKYHGILLSWSITIWF